MPIELRSDTFTKPSEGMLQAMMTAPVGDDVFNEDPTVKKLEQMVAEYFGMQASLFCPSGTMTNQIAIKCHTKPGNEVICEKLSHVYIYEGGGIAFNSGCQVRPLEGDRGRLSPEDVLNAINPDDVHKPITALISIENTSNRNGGSCYELNDLQVIKYICLKNNIKYHLDGARLWNAIIANEEDPTFYGKIFDSISVCLSKGLGAPVGSLIVGSHDLIREARRVRKVLGGGMRQAGILAAAGIYALENNIKRLNTDHDNAKEIGRALAKKDFVSKILPIETNIIIFELEGRYTAQSFCEYLKKRDVLVMAIAPNQVRMVTHLDVTNNMIDELLTIINQM